MSWIDAYFAGLNTVQDDGLSLIQRPVLNFIGATVTDDSVTKVTTVTIPTATPSPQVSAKVVATSDIVLSGTQTIDGALCSVGDRVLAAGQTAPDENGLWIVAAGAWARAADAIVPGLVVFIQAGDTWQGSEFILLTQPPIVVGTTPLRFIVAAPMLDAALFGAVGDGTTDDADAINACAAACEATGSTLVLRQGFTYAIGSQVIFNCHVRATGAALSTTGALNDPGDMIAVLVGATSPRLNRKKIDLPDVIDSTNLNSPPTWVGGFGTGTQRHGIELRNLQDCDVRFGAVFGFTVGAWITSDTADGNLNNRYYLGGMINNAVALQLEPTDTGGFVNENQFIGGDFEIAGSPDVPPYPDTRYIALVDAFSQPPNGNKFLRCDLEGDYPEFQVELQGNYNLFLHCRWETTLVLPKVYLNSGVSTRAENNVFLYGFNTGAIEFSGDATATQMFDTPGWKLDGGLADTGTIVVGNAHGNTDPAIQVMATYANGWIVDSGSGGSHDPSVAYQVSIAADVSKFKADTDTQPRVKIDTLNDSLFFGLGGTADCDSRVGLNAASTVVAGGLEVYGTLGTILGKGVAGGAANYIECGSPSAGISQFTYFNAGSTGIFLGVRISAANVAQILTNAAYSLDLTGQVDVTINASSGDIYLTPVTGGKKVFIGGTANIPGLSSSTLLSTNAGKDVVSISPSTITGALSSVTDANAKAVLTSIISALVAKHDIDGTT